MVLLMVPTLGMATGLSALAFLGASLGIGVFELMRFMG
jgi:hypothetical protein